MQLVRAFSLIAVLLSALPFCVSLPLNMSILPNLWSTAKNTFSYATGGMFLQKTSQLCRFRTKITKNKVVLPSQISPQTIRVCIEEFARSLSYGAITEMLAHNCQKVVIYGKKIDADIDVNRIYTQDLAFLLGLIETYPNITSLHIQNLFIVDNEVSVFSAKELKKITSLELVDIYGVNDLKKVNSIYNLLLLFPNLQRLTINTFSFKMKDSNSSSHETCFSNLKTLIIKNSRGPEDTEKIIQLVNGQNLEMLYLKKSNLDDFKIIDEHVLVASNALKFLWIEDEAQLTNIVLNKKPLYEGDALNKTTIYNLDVLFIKNISKLKKDSIEINFETFSPHCRMFFLAGDIFLEDNPKEQLNSVLDMVFEKEKKDEQ
ncbi:hypothetical protein NEMIN01_1235 [Nematocida minor]|uniref:uncharacterized protein n=1 Tax=Nematocida minor TaxID=1912983 RepID=UPI002220E7E7|nr:uncharacterized protein NEMIN01_1235 [Nematocida minor]KAI5190833.1 hypothetical protein NEMIN01_1235 [Nematocida minor]